MPVALGGDDNTGVGDGNAEGAKVAEEEGKTARDGEDAAADAEAGNGTAAEEDAGELGYDQEAGVDDDWNGYADDANYEAVEEQAFFHTLREVYDYFEARVDESDEPYVFNPYTGETVVGVDDPANLTRTQRVFAYWSPPEVMFPTLFLSTRGTAAGSVHDGKVADDANVSEDKNADRNVKEEENDKEGEEEQSDGKDTDCVDAGGTGEGKLTNEQAEKDLAVATQLEQAVRALQRWVRGELARYRVANLARELYSKEYDGSSGFFYYTDSRTGEAQWHKPVVLGASRDIEYHYDDGGWGGEDDGGDAAAGAGAGNEEWYADQYWPDPEAPQVDAGEHTEGAQPKEGAAVAAAMVAEDGARATTGAENRQVSFSLPPDTQPQADQGGGVVDADSTVGGNGPLAGAEDMQLERAPSPPQRVKFSDQGFLNGPFYKRKGLGKSATRTSAKVFITRPPRDVVPFRTPSDVKYLTANLGDVVECFDGLKIKQCTIDEYNLVRAAAVDKVPGLNFIMSRFPGNLLIASLVATGFTKSDIEVTDIGDVTSDIKDAVLSTTRLIETHPHDQHLVACCMLALCHFAEHHASRAVIKLTEWMDYVADAVEDCTIDTTKMEYQDKLGKTITSYVREPTPDAANICGNACRFISLMANDADDREEICDAMCPTVLLAMEKCDADAYTQLAGCYAIYNFVYRNEAAHVLVHELEGMTRVQHTLDNFGANFELIKIAKRTKRALQPEGWRGNVDDTEEKKRSAFDEDWEDDAKKKKRKNRRKHRDGPGGGDGVSDSLADRSTLSTAGTSASSLEDDSRVQTANTEDNDSNASRMNAIAGVAAVGSQQSHMVLDSTSVV